MRNPWKKGTCLRLKGRKKPGQKKGSEDGKALLNKKVTRKGEKTRNRRKRENWKGGRLGVQNTGGKNKISQTGTNRKNRCIPDQSDGLYKKGRKEKEKKFNGRGKHIRGKRKKTFQSCHWAIKT